MPAFQAAREAVEANANDVNILLLSDSTAESTSEWFYLWGALLADRYPTHAVKWNAWNAGGSSWDSETTIDAGTGSKNIVLWSGCGGSYGVTEHTTLEADILQHPSSVDTIIISLGHNAPRDGASYEAFIDLCQADWPSAEIVLVQQNPWVSSDPWRGSPYMWDTVWQAGWNYSLPVINIWQVFTDTGDLSSYVGNGGADIVHPNTAGSALWAAAMESVFELGALVEMPGLLSRAQFVHRAENYAGTGNWLDESGNGHDGVITGATWLEYDGAPYFYMPGVSGNHLSVPDNAALDITGDIDLRAKIALDDISPTGNDNIISKRSGTGAFQLTVASNAKIYLTWWETGGTVRSVPSTVDLTGVASDGVSIAIRATLDVDNGASDHEVTFYTSTDDGATWDQLGDVTDAGTSATSSIRSTADNISLGSYNAGAQEQMNGRYYWAQIYDGIDGTLVLDVRAEDCPADASSFTERGTGLTVTLNRGSSGYPLDIIRGSVFAFDGTDDLITIADSAALDFDHDEDLTLVWVGRMADDPPASHAALIAKMENIPATGYALYNNTASDNVEGLLRDAGGNHIDNATPVSPFTTQVVVGRRDTTADEWEVFVDGSGSGSPATAKNGTNSLAQAVDVTVGSLGGTPKNFFRGFVSAVALFREALAQGEIDRVGVALTVGERPSRIAGPGQILRTG